MRVAVVVVTWNGVSFIEACISSVLSQNERPDLIVVDNGSSDETVDLSESFRHRFTSTGASFALVQLDSNIGFPAGANRGLRASFEGVAEAVLLLNQDASLEAGCIRAFVEALKTNPNAGCLGAKNLYPRSRRIQHAGGYLERPRMVGQHFGHHQVDEEGVHDTEREVDFVTGSSMFLRRTALQDTGVFNEVFSPGYYEDVELCDRMRQHGWKVLFTPSARVLHHESASFHDETSRLRLAHRNRLIYLLPELASPGAEERFLAAETRYLEREATFEARRAISGASLDLLASLPDCAPLRIGTTPSPEIGDAARRVCTRLRSVCRGLLAES